MRDDIKILSRVFMPLFEHADQLDEYSFHASLRPILSEASFAVWVYFVNTTFIHLSAFYWPWLEYTIVGQST